MAHVNPCATTRNLKFLATFDRMCTGILWRHPRLLMVNNRLIDVAPMELLTDSRRRAAAAANCI